MDYKDQIIAIRNKITSVSETATAEELVYLAGALDKIAEKATIVDIIDAGIKRVVYQTENRDRAGINLLKEHDIIVEQMLDNT